MRVLLSTEFAASWKEPLVEMYDRVLAAFQAAGMEAVVRFSLSDTPTQGGVSSVDRVLKHFPSMQPFLSETAPMPPFPPHGGFRIGDALVAVETLRTILAGVPPSFPFHNIVLSFTGSGFGEGSYKSFLGEISPGIVLGDSWWVNGRKPPSRRLWKLSAKLS